MKVTQKQKVTRNMPKNMGENFWCVGFSGSTFLWAGFRVGQFLMVEFFVWDNFFGRFIFLVRQFLMRGFSGWDNFL